MMKNNLETKIGNTTFRNSAIEQMGFKTFCQVYKDKINGISIEEAYEKITGKKPVKPRKKDSE